MDVKVKLSPPDPHAYESGAENAEKLTNAVICGDNLPVLAKMPDEYVQMIYVDPPFNTGRVQKRQTTTMLRAERGNRKGFGGHSYETIKGDLNSYEDSFEDYEDFLESRLREAHRILKGTGTLYIHLDWREVHHIKVLLDGIFGRECFLNEIIWAYDYGAKSRKKWPTKHDNILVYVKDPKNYYFSNNEVDREPYMAPGLVTKEKAEKGKLPTDVWWHTIVSPTGKEKTGYPTQKPEGLLRRVVLASSRPGDLVLDFFGGSGTTAAVAAAHGRNFVTIDQNPEAIEVMRRRLPEGTVFIGA